MDAGVIVGYLVAFLSGKAKKFADRAVDGLLEQLYGKVAARLRGDSAMRRLEADPSDDQAQADVVQSLSALAGSNKELAGELRRVVAELDRRGAQKIIVSAPVHGSIFQNVTAREGSVVGNIGRDVNIYQGGQAQGIEALRNAGCLTKTVFVLGMILVFAGFAVFGFTLFTDMPRPGDRNFGSFPPGVMLGGGMFFIGIVLLAFSQVSAALRKRR